jgi:hypothetical protein
MKRAAFFLPLLLAAFATGPARSQQAEPLTWCGPKDKRQPAPDFLLEIVRKQPYSPIAEETWWVMDFYDCEANDKPTIEEESWVVFRDLPPTWRGGGIGLIITKSDHRILKTYWSR